MNFKYYIKILPGVLHFLKFLIKEKVKYIASTLLKATAVYKVFLDAFIRQEYGWIYLQLNKQWLFSC